MRDFAAGGSQSVQFASDSFLLGCCYLFKTSVSSIGVIYYVSKLDSFIPRKGHRQGRGVRGRTKTENIGGQYSEVNTVVLTGSFDLNIYNVSRD